MYQYLFSTIVSVLSARSFTEAMLQRYDGDLIYEGPSPGQSTSIGEQGVTVFGFHNSRVHFFS